MDPKDRRRIECNLKSIVDDLMVDDVIPSLIQEGTISLNDCEIIHHEITKRDQSFKLIQIVITRGPRAYNALRKSLLESYQHLVELLDKSKDVPTSPSYISTFDSRLPYDELLLRLREELQTHYISQLKCIDQVPWLEDFVVDLDDVYTSLKIVRGMHRKAFHKAVFQERKYDYTVSTCDIFRPNNDCVNPRRFLVEGEPGIGKSIMCAKLCYDWAKMGSSKEHSITKFDLIFIVKARELELRTPVLECIYNQLLPEDINFSKTEFKDSVKKYAKKTLLIVDGYDEMIEPHQDLLKILQGKILTQNGIIKLIFLFLLRILVFLPFQTGLYQVSVLLTSRPGYALNLMKHFDSVFINIGYDEQKRHEFITKFSSGDPEHSAFKEFHERLRIDGVLNELCRNPLNLSILCLLVAETNTQMPNTRTALYEKLRTFIIKRASITIGIDLHTLEEKCKPLEVVAYTGIKEGRQQVSHTEVERHCSVDVLQHLGFFTKEVTFSIQNRIVNYTFTHKSFQEYFAARYIAKTKRTRQERKEMAAEILQRGTNQLVVVFLCGMLQDRIESLLDIFELLKGETYLPRIPGFQLGTHDVNENHRGHTLFHCLNEISNIPKRLGMQVMNALVDQVCISYPWCSEECVDGLLKFCDLTDEYCTFCKFLTDIRTSVNKLNIGEDGKQLKTDDNKNGSYLLDKNNPIHNNQSNGIKKKPPPVAPRPKVMISHSDNTLERPISWLRNSCPSPTNDINIAWVEKKVPSVGDGGRGVEASGEKMEELVENFRSLPLKDQLNWNRRRSTSASLQGKTKAIKTLSLDDLDENDSQSESSPLSVKSYPGFVDSPLSMKSNPEILTELLNNNTIMADQKAKSYPYHTASDFAPGLQENHPPHHNLPLHLQSSRRHKCNKLNISVPGSFGIERPIMFEKLLTSVLNNRHVDTFGMFDINSMEQLHSLFKTLSKVKRPRMTSLKVKFLGGLIDIEEATNGFKNHKHLDPIYFHWIQSFGVYDCANSNVLQKLLQDIPTANTIRNLIIQNCTFSESALSMLISKVQHMRALRKFEFLQNTVENNDHNSISSLLAAMASHSHIGHFAISHLPTRLNPLALSKSPSSNKLVIESEAIFPRVDEVSQYLTPHLFNIIERNKMTSVNIANTDLGEGILKVITYLLQNTQTLESLELKYCHLLSHGPMEEVLRSSLRLRYYIKRLSLRETELSMESFELIAQLLSYTSSLEKLVLSVINSGAINVISSGLQANTTLTELRLSKLIFHNDNVECLATAIGRHPRLKHLYMSSNDMVPTNMSLIFNGIRASSTLNHIQLHNFGLEDLHMIELSKVLAASTNIMEVDLQKNGITAAGVDNLYKGLLYRTKLLSLDLSDNKAKEYHDEVTLLKSRVLYLKVNWF